VQVAEARHAFLQEGPHVALVVVGAEDDDPDPRELLLDDVRRPDALHRVGGRHLDVHQHGVGAEPAHFGEDPVVVGCDADDVQPRLLEEVPGALPDQVLVLCDQHPEARRGGTRARRLRCAAGCLHT